MKIKEEQLKIIQDQQEKLNELIHNIGLLESQKHGLLHEIAKVVRENNADIGFGFDGDGDRVGVIDNKGNEIFSDKIGLLIARNLSNKHKNSKFVVDVKSTGLYSKDKILLENNCETIYWKTGHSHIKRKVNTEKALAGFEKSGHFFFNQPLGYGYDDGINSAIQVCHLLDNQNKKISEIIAELPNTHFKLLRWHLFVKMKKNI